MKRTENFLRRAVIALLRRTFPAPHNSRRSLPAERPRILLVRTDRLGDAIISTPAIALLRRRFPSARIDILLGAKNAAAAPLLPWIDNVVMLPRWPPAAVGTINGLRSNRYDVAVNLLVSDSATATLMTALSGARIRIGLSGEAGALYSHAVGRPDAHIHIVRQTSMLLLPLGIRSIGRIPANDDERLRILLPRDRRRTADGGRRIIIMNISGSDPTKFWGVGNYARAAEKLLKTGHRVLVASSPDDAGVLEEIVRESGCEAVATTSSFAEFASSLRIADLIVTPDASIVHIAAALGKLAVVLTASDSVRESWYPWGVGHRIVHHPGGIRRIDAKEVIAAVVSLLASDHTWRVS